MNPVRPFLNHIPQIHESCFIDEASVIIGKVPPAEDVSVWPYAALCGDVNNISIGARSNVQDGSVLHVSHKNAGKPEGSPLIIGEDIAVGHKVMLHDCRVGDRVLVGMGTIILDGTVIENDAMIDAGNLVSSHKRLESGYLYAGSPVRQARLLTEKEKEFLKYSSAHYMRLAWQHRQLEQFSDDLARLKHSTFLFTQI